MNAINRAWLQQFRRRLIAWYQRSARPLPWRETRDPYRIWVSEIMLQQTTVVAVAPYFSRFLGRFPTLADLAGGSEEEVLRLWEGLGYYSRARNLHKAAQVVMTQHGGQFPNTAAALESLPGIGRYTAGAIASFAFDRPAPIVEANTLRLYCRLLAFDGDPRSAAGQKLLWEFAARVLPRKSPGRFNQALIELGATICKPESPACPTCPVKTACAAFTQGIQHLVPRPAVRPEMTDVTETAVVVMRGQQRLLIRRAPGERWGGLWDFPRFSINSHGNPAADTRAIAEIVFDRLGVQIGTGKLLAVLRHTVTRYRITLRCYVANQVGGELADSLGVARWVTPAELDDLPLSTTGRKIARLLSAR